MGKLTSIRIDCANAVRGALFWAGALDGYMTDATEKAVKSEDGGPPIYFQEVPEPAPATTRVQLNLATSDVSGDIFRMTRLGAKIVAEREEGNRKWTVLQDPEGTEFSVKHQSEGDGMARLNSITIDCKDAESLAGFWVKALDGYEVDSEWAMVLKSDSGPTIFFQGVPEAKQGKNRVHLDIAAPDRPAEVIRLKSLGAKVFKEMEEGGYAWTIMQDLEGNEFCVTQTRE
jgi:predicted enzyme related to lactoylglutathione lyase